MAASPRAAQHPLPPPAERELGLASYLAPTPGIGGKLRGEPEDFQVIETGAGPPADPEGRFVAARVRLRNWETNRFAGMAARQLGIARESVAFAGMKDKRAVTEQWFTFRCAADRVGALAQLQDVEVLEWYPARKASFTGAHAGNRFVIRVRGSTGDRAAVEETAALLRSEGGVPNYFGPQRFGGAFRPITHKVGEALVAGDLEECVRLFVGHPVPGERVEAQEARRVYDETRDPLAALKAYPAQLDPERALLQRLAKRPGDFRHALLALPPNLLQLFVHARQSWLYNLILSARLEAGLGVRTAHVGDLVLWGEEDGTRCAPVRGHNQARVQREIDLGRGAVTAPLVGMGSPLAEGEPGRVERAVLDEHGVDPKAFRVRELPELASEGRRRGILQPVRGLAISWAQGDPVFSFELGKGSYATVVLREFMKAETSEY